VTAETAEWQAGIYDMDEAAYHADPVPGGSLSSSGARKLLPPSCPALYRWERDHPVFKDVFDFGSAAHKLILGAGPKIEIVDKDSWRTNEAKDAAKAARAAGHIPLLIADSDQVLAMASALRQHPVASVLFDPERGGSAEQSLFWPHSGGAWLRARLDWLPLWGGPGRMIIPDYKTTASADPGQLAKAVANFGYHCQASFYLDGVKALGLADDPAFIFVCQEKTAPYLVTVIELDDTALRIGRELNARAIEIFRDCTEADVWPGYSSEIELISLPAWARMREDL
jgi:hypothetical protein